jgi:diaminopimelate decarboxylase/aspartate kinase
MPVQDETVFGPSWRRLTDRDGAHGRSRPSPWWQGEREALLRRGEQGTPVYVYHLPTVRERARALKAIAAIDRRYYAIKANPNPDLLRTLYAEGFGIECVSQGELERTRPEYEAAYVRGATVTLDNVEALRRWPEIFRGRALWLRLDLGRGDGHHAKVVTGGIGSKFGLPLVAFDDFVSEARRLDVRITGIHAHLGSGIATPAHWREVYAELAGFADGIGTVATIDIGGGLPIPYKPDAEPFDLQAWAAGLAEIKSAYARYALAIEPGRFLVAESGALLAHVTQVVEKQGVHRVGLDAGMHTLMRPALYDAYHGIHNLSRLDEPHEAPCDVVGPICESSDVFGTARRLPAATREGDVILIADAGAYGRAMSNAYNLRGLPREHVIDG